MTDADRYDDRVGWHRDPTGRYEYRWFNGVSWTGDVAVGGQQYVDPLGVAPTPMARRARRGLAIASMIVGIGSLVLAMLPLAFVGGAIGGIVAIVTGAVALGRARRQRPDTVPGTPTSTGKAFAVAGLVLGLAALPTCVLGYYFSAYLLDRIEEATDLGEYRAVVDTCDAGDYLITMTGTITNLDDTEHAYDITVSFVAGLPSNSTTVAPSDGTTVADGQPLGSATVSNLRVAAGQSATFTAGSFDVPDELDPSSVRCVIESVDPAFPFAVD